MSESESDLRNTLERVGEAFDLGEYEIEAYLAVLQHGELTASDIAAETDIPQPRVYDTVRSLGERGLVEIRESRPMKAIAVEPAVAFENLQSNVTSMVDDLEQLYTAPARDTEAVSLVKSRSTIHRYFGDVIEAAEYELVASLTPSLLDRFSDELEAARERGVHVTLVLTPAVEAPDPDEYDYDAVASVVRGRRGITTPVLAVADGDYSIYATQDAVREDPDRYGVIFHRSALGFLVSGFFNTVIWTTADFDLLAESAATALPRRYASLRRCVKDLQAIDGDVHATVEGRDVETGDARVVAGPVVDVDFDESEEVATLYVEDGGERVSVGGRVAAYEDVEAHEIELREN
ncbi:HTH-type sugar sensing transcriptional regulator TrmB [Halocalculus aciditolerans]|uniref:ArsR family transcriptional regulator n=1 Tax=Halocalculus aciditolerans TaxID=1383812 RepID=A0A830F1U0_9EURY|nr:TrmB family transcriptional regulator [Halocalculus aciditolerans]GGL53541.1 ArsR family transcriptional regulator [Halocalculus aciditolerans]